ncbi:hypothetical protein HA402_003557 [Bradysia odoriphaga]|nr:hypothetical protein HA402_003557 [Bradysia odoriphaga]
MPVASHDNFFGAWGRQDSNGNCIPSRTIQSTPRSTPYNSRHNSPISGGTPESTSPLSTSPIGTLRRNYSSTFTLIPEDRALEIPPKRPEHTSKKDAVPQLNIIVRIVLWIPLLILSLVKAIVIGIVSVIFRPLSFAAPTFWISAGLWLFWKMFEFPFTLVSYILPTRNGDRNRTKRTIMISCGSTVQTLHLARDFYSAGARVIVFDYEGLFGLARFSTAVSKYYTVPKPTLEASQDYISSLCDIVQKENISYYIPVCATQMAYFDALAKPHLELLGCTSFLPGSQEVSVLDDIYEVLKRCRSNDIPTPNYQVLHSKEDLHRLYVNGWISGYRNILIACGLSGILDRQKYVLPMNRRDLKFGFEISEMKPWIVIRDLPGVHYVTCTTVKDSEVVANVTCSVQQETRSLMPDKNKDIEDWLKGFFSKVRLQRPINGHISFRFVRCEQTQTLYPIGTRVGVSLPYICHTGIQSRYVICKPCPHFVRQKSGQIELEGGRYWIHDLLLNTLKHPSVDAVGKLIGTVLDKREALFVYWDPMPYLVHYHLQLPFKSVKAFLQRRKASGRHTPTLAATV